MKRNMKSVITVLLALVMTLCMAQSAFAEEPAAAPTAKIKISNGKAGCEYSVFKVMDAEIVAKDGSLAKYTVDPEIAGFFNKDPYAFDETKGILNGATVVAGDTEWKNDNTTETAALASALAAYAKAHDTAVVVLTADQEATLPLGYYVVVQTRNAENGADSEKKGDGVVATKPILVDLLKDKTNITLKDDKITLDKVIVEDGKDKKANDANIGDTVSFKISTSIPTYEANVDVNTLQFTLTDTFSAGFTYDPASLEIAGFVKDTDYTAVYDEATRKLTIDFKPATINSKQGTAVVATYGAVLNENAVVNSTVGNPNDVKLEYTHNPNEGKGGKTLEDKTKTYTYGIGIHKVEPNREGGEDKDLPDAEFQIKDSKGTVIKFIDNGNGTYTKATEEQLTDETLKDKITDTIVSQQSGLASVKGLDEGTYSITETKAPDQYTKIEGDITVTITADKNEGEPTGTATVTAGGAGDAEMEGNKITDSETGEQTGSVKIKGDGTIDAIVLVKNYKGITLPETGATSAMFCMIGGIAILLLAGLYYEFAIRRAKDVK